MESIIDISVRIDESCMQALTIPLAWLPGVPEMIFGQPYLWAEVARQICNLKIRATNVFLRQTTTYCTPYMLLILKGILHSDCHVELIYINDLNDRISDVFNFVYMIS